MKRDRLSMGAGIKPIRLETHRWEQRNKYLVVSFDETEWKGAIYTRGGTAPHF